MTDSEKVAEYLRRATLDLRAARQRIRELESDPIAIVSMACRLPGGVNTPQRLWELLREGGETLSGFPTDRGWDLARLHHPDPDNPGTSYVDKGGFLDDAAGFDAEFFGVSPREAAAMDPQQRLLLETSWELVENAGIDPHSLRGTATGVFLGVAKFGYGEDTAAAEDVEGYSVTGVAPAVASGRISYTMGLEGPSISVDTACSSSLVALHLAVESLRKGESSMAVVGGAAVMATPGVFVDFSRQRALAADGRSKAFGAGADGFGFSEGVTLVLLERLSEARRNGHEVLAVVRGSALNQDGASNGLSAPSGPAQRRVIRQALESCGLEPGDVDAVEAHGTGTALGDPIEANALLDTYGRDRDADRPLWLGSVKSNIGHTQAAAGVTGLLKVVLALRNGELPATLHVEEPTPHVDWSSGGVALLAGNQPWRRGERTRRARVSAFGISGTNAHVIVEEAPEREHRETTAHDGRPVPLVVSARTTAALRAQAAQIAELLERPDADLAGVGLGLATTRARHEHRAAVVASTREEAVRGLREIAAGAATADAVVEGVTEVDGRNVVFLFPGQGSQWAGMGAELLSSSPVFAGKIRACDESMAPMQDWKVSDVLRQAPGAPGLDRVDVVQPVLFAVMVSLAELWRSYGVEPAAVVGHSQGEIAAAHVAGALTLEDAAKLVVGRSRLMRSLSGEGGMAAVALGEAAVRERLRPWQDRLSVAAVNGPRSVVVSGEPGALRAFSEDCAAEGIRVRDIDVDYASHSPQIERVREELLETTGDIAPRPARVTFHSTVESRSMDGTELDARYWYRNLRETVRFADAVTRLAESGYDAFIEVSPHPVVVQAVEEAVEEADGAEDAVVVGSLHRDGGDLSAFLRSMATAHVSGVDIRWDVALPGAAPFALPTYPFQRKRYWLQPAAPAAASDELAYRVSWTPIEKPESGNLDGDWLVVTPLISPEWTEMLCEAINANGGRALRCEVDTSASRTEMAQAVAQAGTGFRGVLSLLSSDESACRPGVPAGAVGLLTLVQALGDAGVDAPVWCLTQGAVRTPADDDLARPAQTTAHGFAQVAGLELPGRWGGVVDLPESVDDAALRLLVAVLRGGGRAEDHLAVRDGRLHGRRVVRASLPQSGSRSWTPHGTVLVTGAASPVGDQLVRWLADRGAERLVLAGACPGDDLLAAVEEAGASAVVCAQDAAALREALGDEPVTALVHAGTLTNFGSISEVAPEEFAETIAAKTALLAVLDEVLGDRAVEREVYCSSVAGIWGGAGMAAYAAGSAYLDALAEHHRARGRSCTSVAWTPWALPGGAVDDGYLRERGLRSLSADRAMRTWERVLAAGPVSVAVADVDWPVLSEGFAATRPTALFAELAGRGGQAEAEPDSGPTGEPAQRLAGLSPDEQQENLLELVANAVAEVLGHESAAEINVRRAFSELGLDSLNAMALRKRLSASTGLRLPASLVFDHPTVTALAQHLRARLVGDADQAAVRVVGAADESEPIAIVGIGCRFPGGIGSPEQLWRVLAEGANLTTGFPADRGWDIGRLYHPDPDNPGTSYVDKGGFLTDAADFDPGFFGITPREALAMDPQQRLMLETAWEAVERAGIDPDALRGTDTGVFVGMNGQSYMQLLAGEAERVDGYQGLGNSASVLSGRIAYTFGWEGPALTVDTACSSSLVGIHLAMQALRRGECSLALAGGVTVMSDPYTFVDFSTQRGLASDGRCKAFSARADGFALSEGVAALVLEPLSRARANGHQVLAVLRGSAVNQDGASNGLAAPNGPSQERVIRQALAASGVPAADVDVVEAHGTGTELGDPIEAGALIATYGQDRDRPLRLGSVKTNIGHTQAAAGAAGVIKVVLAMRHGMLPRSLHADELSPHIDWESGAVEVLREEVPWPAGERPRRAGVSSFGVSGTNAHVIVEEAPAEQEAARTERGPLPFVLSGRSEAVVAAQARALAEHLRDTPELGLTDAAWTLATGRARFDVRAAVLGDDRAGVCAELDALAEGRPSADAVAPVTSAPRKPVLVFPGQGAQWVGMARDLLESSEVFAESMSRCAEALSPHTDWKLLDVVRGDGGPDPHERVDVLQPVLFSIMVSLAELWRAHGVTPAAVVGHSQGEIAAAHVAGALSLEAAAKVVALRSQVLRELDDQGGMVSVGASRDELETVLARWDGRVAVAAVNGPGTSVVAGPTAELDEFFAEAEAREMKPRRIAVRYASHSPEVARIEDRLAAELGTITAVRGSVPLHSTVTGEVIDTSAMDASYWYRNLRRPVLFEQAVRGLVEQGFDTFVEVSPHPVLLMAVEETAEHAGAEVTCVPTLRREQSGPHEFLRNLLRAHVHGVGADLRPAVAGGRPAELPTYPFEHQRFWPRPHRPADVSALGVRGAEHPLLLAAVDVPGHGGAVFTGRLSTDEQPWLAEHVVGGRTLVPGSVLVDLALAAGEDVGLPVLEELVLQRPLVLAGAGALLRMSVGAPDESGRRTIDVHAAEDVADLADAQWSQHATGTLAQGVAAGPRDTEQWPPEDAVRIPLDDHYDGLAEQGYEYGPSFQALRAAWRKDDSVYAEVSIAADEEGYAFHPVLLDAVAQTLSLGALGEPGGGKLPFAWNTVTLHASGATSVRVVATPAGADAMALRVTDPAGHLVATVDSLVVRSTGEKWEQPEPRGGEGELHALDWGRLAEPGSTGRVVAADASDLDAVLRSGEPEPDAVLVRYEPEGDDPRAAARHGVLWAAALVRRWLEQEELPGATLVIATSGAVTVSDDDSVPEPGAAAMWGVIRCAQAESPDRFVLLDTDAEPGMLPAVPDNPQLALRGDDVFVPRLSPLAPSALTLPAGTQRLVPGDGAIDSVAFEPAPDVEQPLRAGEVRVDVRATGVNFRDVLLALGMYPQKADMGTEAAGVVTAVGPDVDAFAPGDRVLGLFQGAFAPIAVTDHRLLARVPDGWSDADAAAVPIAYTTAHYALHDLAGLRAGQSVLIHAAAGGVGMAAVALARRAGAEVLATAGPAKHGTLRALGLDDEHIASSRETGFARKFRERTGGRGVDVVLNSLTGELLDESADLLAEDGVFVEMGKTDLRDAGDFRGRYAPFDLGEAGDDRLGEILREVVGLLGAGELDRLPVSAWELGSAPAALQHMSRGRHVGKLVLTQPAPVDPDGTVLITGGTGTLGRLLARHLVTEHGVRHLLLVSRRGADAPGSDELRAEIEDLGASAEIAACDTADRDALSALLDGLPRPLTGVVHAAGVLADGLVTSIDEPAVEQVLRAKVDAAWNLHELTANTGLSFFVLFSSAASVLAGPGQGVYAAANESLNALAALRRTRGLPAKALGWGLWAQASEMTSGLGDRIARTGVAALPTERALALFDSALRRGGEVVFPLSINRSALRRAEFVPEVLRGMVRAKLRAAGQAEAAGPNVVDRLAGRSESDQVAGLAELVRSHAAAVSGYGSADQLPERKAFKDLGFDSLAAVELRNRLGTATGVRLPSTLVFDHPTPLAVAEHLRDRLFAASPAVDIGDRLDELEKALEALSAEDGHDDVGQRLESLLRRWNSRRADAPSTSAISEDASDDELFSMLDQRFGGGEDL
uniref:Erythronolide synthase EryA2 n=2 Tax=Saccharopolyspora erythraea TaxID=1836 RepID=ERYA2_SACER|nr:RecName: Full=6-deoxyerythronolide-B synthase EryA2, modules 3 and 4; Short=DEBS 2; AltName: Full=6-deoxyerythronolide B synthase II; AltName: Full=Erythronolide synthase; AltName: Full=ORF B [Saccharopolyspora erythraea]AAA26494.1 eryA ORF2 encoding modules 3 & 4 for 6-deoxyerythronolide B formation6-deoxyerythronolide B formation; putative [Saccharopolyspora erythraea]